MTLVVSVFSLSYTDTHFYILSLPLTLLLKEVKWSFREVYDLIIFFCEVNLHEVSDFFGEVKWKLVKSHTVHRGGGQVYTKKLLNSTQSQSL